MATQCIWLTSHLRRSPHQRQAAQLRQLVVPPLEHPLVAQLVRPPELQEQELRLVDLDSLAWEA